MAGQAPFGTSTGGPSNTASYNDSGVDNVVNVPTGRAMANGDTRILPLGGVFYAGGSGGTRSGTFYVGGSSFNAGIPAASGGHGIGTLFTTRALAGPGGTVGAGIYFSGGYVYFGWNAVGGRTLHEKDGSTRSSACIAGYYDWAEAPTAPTSVAGTPISGAQITVGWAAPSSNGGSAITGYRVELSADPSFTGASVVNVGAGVRTQLFTGLAIGTVHYFRVAARNEVTNLAGTYGVLSGAGNATTFSAPDAPTGFTATPSSSTAVDLAWVAGANNGSPITSYQLERASNPAFTGATVTNPTGTTTTIAGLTPGNAYYFRVKAINAVGTGPAASPDRLVTLGSAPDAPTGVVASPTRGALGVRWTAPGFTGGQPITSYRIEYGTDPAFASFSTLDTLTTDTSRTIVGLLTATTYYARVRATNSIGTGAASGSADGAVPARTALDMVKAASVSIDGMVVSIASDGAATPTLTLGYTAFGTGTTFVSIGDLTVGPGAFSLMGQLRNIAMTADAAGNIYIVSVSGADGSSLLAVRYPRTGASSWGTPTVSAQAVNNTGNPITQLAAVCVPGTGGSPVPHLFVLFRRAGSRAGGSIGFATLNVNTLTAGVGSMISHSHSFPSWLSAAPSGATADSGSLDVAALVPNGTRLAMLADGESVIDVTNGVITNLVSKSPDGTWEDSQWARVLGINATTYAVVTAPSDNKLYVKFRSAGGSALGTVVYNGSNFSGGAPYAQWDAYYDALAQVVTVYYIADAAGARTLESIDINPSTYSPGTAVVLTSVLGAASSTNDLVRVPNGSYVDERRILVEAANLLTGTKSIAAYSDRTGNAVPSAPVIVGEAGYDASSSRVFSWAFGDLNRLDTQTAYEFQMQRVSDSVDVVATGKVAGAAQSRTVAAATLTNGVDYRWRVRTYDALDTAGTWSAYDAFTVSALGTLTITDPVADNPVGLEVSSLDIAWSYSQADGYVQTQRRVRVIKVAGGVVLSDTAMQASAVASYTVTALPTDVPLKIEVSIVTNAPGTPTVTTNRLLTTSYGSPMAPTAALTVGVSYVEIAITNPTPTGSRPEVIRNDIERSKQGVGSFTPIASVPKNGTYQDHAVASATGYDYRVKGVSN